MTASVLAKPRAAPTLRSALAAKVWPAGRSAVERAYVVMSAVALVLNGLLSLRRNQCRFTSSPRTSSAEPRTPSAPMPRS